MIVEKITTKAVRKTFRQELWRLRQKHNLSLEELSRRTGILPKALQKAELGRGIPVYTLIKVIIYYRQKIKIELVD